MESDQRLLSAQSPPQNLYTVYDAEDLLLVTPSRWYPGSKTRINGMYIFYLISLIGSISGIIWPIIRYKHHPIFIDLTPIKWGTHFIYFSYWMLCLHVFFYLFSAFDLKMRYRPSSPTIHALKERLYDATFSLTTLQFVVFWAFVFTERVKNIGEQTVTYEVWLIDFISNFLPMIFIIIETVIVHHRFAETLCQILYEVIFPIIIYGSYVGFSVYAHDKNQHWPYPIQNRTKHQGLILFYVCGGLILILGYVTAKVITRFLWSDAPKENPEEDVMQYHGSFTTASVFSSFANDTNGQQSHYIQPQRHNNHGGSAGAGGAESLVVGSPQNAAYNGYGTVDPYNGKGYY